MGGVGSAMAMFSNLLQKYFTHSVRFCCHHLFFSLEAVSRGRPFSSTRLVYPPSSPSPASHSSNLARSCFARAASWIKRNVTLSRRAREKTHPDVPQVLILLRILPVDISVRLGVRVGVVAVRVLAVRILASRLFPELAWWREPPWLRSVSC